MEIIIKNVCNIKEGTINIESNTLNVYYGNNGIGKSSITKALRMYTDEYQSDSKKLTSLIKEITPYDGSGNPDITFNPDDKPKSMMIFNQEYIKNFLFQKKGLFSDTFNIVMKNAQTEVLTQQLNILVNNIRISIGSFKDEIDKWEEFRKKFLIKSDNKLSKDKKTISSKVACGKPKKEIETPYAENINLDGWVEWITKGKEYVNMDNPSCPFCLNKYIDDKLKEIDKILEVLNSKDIVEHKEAVRFIKESLGIYLDEKEQERLDKIFDHPGDVTQDETKEIIGYIGVVATEFDKINALRQIGQIDFNIVESIEELNNKLIASKLNVDLFERAGKKDKAIELNEAIDELIASSKNLVDVLNKLNSELQKNVEENKNFINDFLDHAGMLYRIDVNNENDNFETVLISTSANKIVSTPDTNLSFGEHNALALMLFAIDAIKKRPDYIILDDPISSFDMNKKYALMYQLFGANKNNFRGKTVLMFTHEFDVVIDTVKTRLFNVKEDELAVKAWYVYNKCGMLDKKPINENDILGVAVKERDLAVDPTKSKIVRILHARRFEEITYPFSKKVNAVLSSFLHCLDCPKYLDGFALSKGEQLDATSSIRKIRGKINGQDSFFSDFDYSLWINEYNNNDKIKSDYNSTNSSYEKLVIARFYLNYLNKLHNYVDIKNKVFMSYLNSAYHIENESVSSLTEEFDIIPQYIIEECDEFMKNN